jgi:uncharacterized protein (TIGR02594 family)
MTATDILRFCPWVLEMRRFLGKAETPGPQTAPFISKWLKTLHAPWLDDETPWCGTAVAGCLEAVGLQYPKTYYRARSWVGFGIPIATGKAEVADRWPHIPYGALLVLDRPPSTSDGHVGFYAGTAQRTDTPQAVSLLAGNQGNAVTFASFPMRRVIYAGWPGPSLSFPQSRALIAAALDTRTMPPASGGEA